MKEGSGSGDWEEEKMITISKKLNPLELDLVVWNG